jgi:hypothetical protein
MWNKIEDGKPTTPCLVVVVGWYDFGVVDHEPMIQTIYDCNVFGDKFYDNENDREIIVTHWMKLPELP